MEGNEIAVVDSPNPAVWNIYPLRIVVPSGGNAALQSQAASGKGLAGK